MHPSEVQPTYKKIVLLKATKCFVVPSVFSLKKRRNKKRRILQNVEIMNLQPTNPFRPPQQLYWKVFLNDLCNKIDL